MKKPTKPTIPQLFIVESLTLKDEKKRRFEGEILSRMLYLAGKTKTKYIYIRTKRELKNFVKVFGESRYRYLHLSCHANSQAMYTTFDEVNFCELGAMLRPWIRNRRVFVSACEMANSQLAGEVLRGTGCYSLIGPARDIRFDDAAAFWVSFYHLMFKLNPRTMKNRELRERIRELSEVFEESFEYFAASRKAKRGFVRVK